MGNVQGRDAVQVLMDLGYPVHECREALAANGGDVDRAAVWLQARRQRPFGERLNAILRTQRPWNEFFERFLWPEHLHERVQTNLHYYRGNYLVICFAILLLALLANPMLLLVAVVIAGVRPLFATRPPPSAPASVPYVFDACKPVAQPMLPLPMMQSATAALCWDDTTPLPFLNQPLRLDQRLAVSGLASTVAIHQSGSTAMLGRAALLCGGIVLSHATFRARSLSARWAHFAKDVKAE
jgi:hypothetical protein